MNVRITVLLVILASVILLFRIASVLRAPMVISDGEKVTLTVTLQTQPAVRFGRQVFALSSKTYAPIHVVTSQYPQYYYADRLYISGTIKTRLINSGKPVMTMYFPKIEAEKQSNFSPLVPVQKLREKVTDFFVKTLPPIPAALLLGIVFGIRETLPSDFSNALKQTGVMHVVAASGMNVSMVSGALLVILSRLVRRRVAIVLSIVGIFLYALLAGFEPSIVRAALMASFAFGAQLFGRQQLSVLSLFFAGFLMLFISPLLITDIGFYLSFFATAGILFLKPLLPQQRRDKNKTGFSPRALIMEDLTTTVAAQLATVPLLLLFFGQYSFLSILVNMIVLWTVPILMLIGGIATIVAIIIAPLGQLILYLAMPFLLYFQWVIERFTTVSTSWDIQDIPIPLIIGYYFLLLSVILVKRKRVFYETI